MDIHVNLDHPAVVGVQVPRAVEHLHVHAQRVHKEQVVPVRHPVLEVLVVLVADIREGLSALQEKRSPQFPSAR